MGKERKGKDMTTIEKVVIGVIVILIVFVIISWCILLKSCRGVVEKRGLKSIVEEIWEGSGSYTDRKLTF